MATDLSDSPCAKPELDRHSGSAPNFPTEFRGCQWNDHWEFDAPAAIYYPRKYMRVGQGGNTGCIDEMVEGICFDIGDGNPHNDGGLDRECEWRGWSKRGFARRRAARHVVIKVRWEHDGKYWNAAVISREETYGLPARGQNIECEPTPGKAPS